MCGIAGYVNRSGKEAQKEIIAKMLAKLHHRGPDNSDFWSHENLCLGYTRLSILDLSDHGNQPFITEDRKGVLVYNGEVYNFRELRNELKKEGVSFISRSDTEAVLYALHTWGPEKAASKFNGMFAFAYYDLRTKTLWLGRDRAGIKPLYTAQVNGVFAFASEMKALFEHPSVPCRADMHAITTYIMENRLDRWTPFENVREVEPGSLLKLTSDTTEQVYFYDLLRDLDVNRIADGDKTPFEGWLTTFEELFEECVLSHMISDAPLATMCSGGVDSSLIAAISKKNKHDLTAYVADVEGVKISEKERAKRVCNHLEIELRTVPVSREKYLNLWPEAAYHHDEPIFFRQNMLHMAVAEKVSEDGFKVLLCGEGADELFGGYDWQAKIYEMWQIRRRHSNLFPDNRLTRLISKYLPQFKPLDLNQLQNEPFTQLGKNPPAGRLDGRYLTAIDGGQRPLRRREMMAKLAPLKKLEDRAFLARTFEDFMVHLATSLKTVDKMNMANSVESRVPFLDHRLIDFALHLPANTKYLDGVSKPLLKEAASKKLPRDLMNAQKVGFGVSHQLWKNTWKFLDGGWVEEQLKWRTSNRDGLNDAIRSDSRLEFQLVSLEIWARLYFNSETPEDISEKLLSLQS